MRQKYCPSYWGYSITENGQVFTHRKRFGLGKGNGGGVKIDWSYQKKLNPYEGHGGYMYVSVSTSRGQRGVPIHTLLLDAFVGVRPKGAEIRHLDGNPKNNQLCNLVYGTAQENANDRVAHGHQPKGKDHHRAKLNKDEVIKIRGLYKGGGTIASLARLYRMSESGIRDIVKRRNWKHV